MEFFKKTPSIPFMAGRRWCYAFSIALMVVTLALLLTRGLNFGPYITVVVRKVPRLRQRWLTLPGLAIIMIVIPLPSRRSTIRVH